MRVGSFQKKGSIKICVHSILNIYMEKYIWNEKGTSSHFNARLEEHKKTIDERQFEKFCIMNEKSTHYYLWDKVQIIDREHCW